MMTPLRPLHKSINTISRLGHRSMTTIPPRTTHDERTATEPRSQSMHKVTISHIKQINRDIKTFQLRSEQSIPFKPGQWLDVFIPNRKKPGGFTITSAPSLASSSPAIVELAVQKSPVNPAAAWLWQNEADIINQPCVVRVGGSFTWPPDCWNSGERPIEHVLFVAGGVGINPLISMVRHFIVTNTWPNRITFLYSTKITRVDSIDGSDSGSVEEILFLRELKNAERAAAGRMDVKLFITGRVDEGDDVGHDFVRGRISEADLVDAIAGEEDKTVCFVCGVPTMTDGFVKFLSEREGMSENRVVCERWW